MANNTAPKNQDRLNTALSTLNAGGTVPINSTSAARKVNNQIYIYNPKVINAYEFVGNNSKLQAAINAGKISPISQADLARALSPTVSQAAPKPAGSNQPKKKVKGKADDDSGKKSKVKVRKEADPELSPGKRLKNPLGALASYNYQLSLYMVTPDALDAFRANGFKNINSLGVASAGQLSPISTNNAVSPGAYIVAQSGGVDNVHEQRAPSFAFDYGIDNLTFEISGPKDNGSATAETNFSFTITEPLGFSFISNLKRASDAIQDYSKKLANKQAAVAKKKAAADKQRSKAATTTNGRQANEQQNATDNNGGTKGSTTSTTTPQNPTKNFFVLGIRFYGYNSSGQLVRGTDTIPMTNGKGEIIPGAGQEIDPGNTSYALFERYYPISMNEVKTRVDGRATTYTIKATSYNLAAIGTKRGIINNKVELTASTVGEAFDKLMARLNKEQQKLTNSTDPVYTYDIKYSSGYDADRLRSSRIVSKADLDKYKWPGSGAKTTKESNASRETKQGNKPKNNARTITIAEGTPILQALNQIVAQSSFLEDALRTVFTTALEPDQDKEDLPALDNTGKKTIEWFHCTPQISNAVWNEKTADWVYDIDYVLNVYDTPVLDTAYTNPGKKYYGPVKRYEYWYTGTNTEVLKYEQTLDNNYYNVFLADDFGKDKKNADSKGGTNTKQASGGSGNASGVTTSKVENQKTGQPTQGKAGNAMEAQNSYMTSLFDPSNQAKAVVDILGDPDWLMSSSTNMINNKTGQTLGSTAVNESVVYNKFYGNDGYSVNPSGGQVFFEIDFKEAVDYKSGGMNIPTKDGSGVSGAPGTLSINSSILFWKDPKSISKLVKGISYSLTKCKCIFSNGVFKQQIEGFINTFGDSGSNDDGKARENTTKNSNSGQNKGSTGTTQNKGQTAAPSSAKTTTAPTTRTATSNLPAPGTLPSTTQPRNITET